MSNFTQRMFVAALAVASLTPLAAAQAPDVEFDLHPNPKFVACLGATGGPAPTAHVTVKRNNRNETLTIEGNNIRPDLAFDMFTIEKTNLLSDGSANAGFNGSFGLAHYQSDLKADRQGHFKTTIRTVLLDDIFSFDPDVTLAPVNTFHVGFWFDNPSDANANGCTFDITKATPFNGIHNAGPVAMISVPDADTNLGPLCTNPNLGTNPVSCTP